MLADLCLDGLDNRLFHLGGRAREYRSKPGYSSFPIQAGLRDIVAVARAGLGGLGWDHAMVDTVK